MEDRQACCISVLHKCKSAKTLQNQTANMEKANYILLVLNFHEMHSEVTFLQLYGAVGLLKSVFCQRTVLLCSVVRILALVLDPPSAGWLGGPLFSSH